MVFLYVSSLPLYLGRLKFVGADEFGESGFHPFGSTLQECASRVAVWRKAPLRHEAFLWGGWLGDTVHRTLSCLSYRQVTSEKLSLTR
ncbi:hypothetical protein SAMN02746098_03076 [Desulfosporosinus lacus DSM 15449]|uniref:Uncharacterized protein n=1 Tax=Desulfosporosinus lacus DSM 15449 TaxID=1121420 RepID=A0A1M5Z7U5_9FIRM|nr:hypothetical protein SAMN02746098_03076 [Desulfosporosinus lacus DSM 15449]